MSCVRSALAEYIYDCCGVHVLDAAVARKRCAWLRCSETQGVPWVGIYAPNVEQRRRAPASEPSAVAISSPELCTNAHNHMQGPFGTAAINPNSKTNATSPPHGSNFWPATQSHSDLPEEAGTDINAGRASAATRFPLRVLESRDASHSMRVSRRLLEAANAGT